MDSTTEALRIECNSCGKKIKVPTSAAGKRARCPACQTVLTVPAPDSQEASDVDDPFAALSGGEVIESQRPVLAPPKPVPQSSSIARKAVAADPDDGEERPSALENPFVRMAMGTGLASVACVIGAVVWYQLEINFGMNYGYLAVAIGAAAGVAMYLGLGRLSESGGIIAGMLAVAAIIIAKHVSYFTLAGMIADAITPNPNHSPRERLAYYVAMDMAEPPEFTVRMSPKRFATMLEEAIVEALPAAKQEVATWDPVAIKSELEEFDADNREFRSLVLSSNAGWQAFGLLDMVFCMVAIGAAWRLGSRGWGSGE